MPVIYKKARAFNRHLHAFEFFIYGYSLLCHIKKNGKLYVIDNFLQSFK